uniref:Secreted protein n=1 Tax=Angiostrongylus cantonensis TaxID=6313 RepID=A0A0K0D6F1_ANGCA
MLVVLQLFEGLNGRLERCAKCTMKNFVQPIMNTESGMERNEGFIVSVVDHIILVHEKSCVADLAAAMAV